MSSTDPIGLAWLVTGRWTTLVAAAGAVIAGRNALDAPLPVAQLAVVVIAILLTNLWLWWRVRSGRTTAASTAGGLLCMDVLLLSWLLLRSGGVLNPASVFYLVQIVLAALVLGRTWAWGVAGISVVGYAGLFLGPTDDLQAAQAMHPEIALHMRGMWIAFALTALIVAVLVTRLATAVERRDRSLAVLRDRNARATRVAGLATVVAGAAHELSTPLSTMAVAARELERAIDQRGADRALADDARLIRAEIDRCRVILDQMAGRIAEPAGEAPQAATLEQILAAVSARLDEPEKQRVVCGTRDQTRVVWPIGVIAQAIGNFVRNGLQASVPESTVTVDASPLTGGRVQITVTDGGRGMRPDELARAGEPFFTTKPAGAGMGLGVFVARSAVEQLGGTVTLQSRAGHGTTVTVVLPADVVRAAESRE